MFKIIWYPLLLTAFTIQNVSIKLNAFQSASKLDWGFTIQNVSIKCAVVNRIAVFFTQFTIQNVSIK